MRLCRAYSRYPFYSRFRTLRKEPKHPTGIPREPKNKWLLPSLLVLSASSWVAYEHYQPFRHSVLAVMRCSRVAGAAISSVIDYKWTMGYRTYASEEEKTQGYSECHKRSAYRVLQALLANGGIFIKLGQHMASMIVLPQEWTSTMRPLQDQCQPTPYEDLESMFLSDMGESIEDLFEDFAHKPIGVASLAQVHRACHRPTGKQVAVKLQHPHLAEFCDIDMNMVEVSLGWVKYWFPEFEFTWLGEEMRTNLPKEMDFIHEARNTLRTVEDFRDIKTSLYIPDVISANKRVLIMEFIEGGRVDDLHYLADHNIDRNKVALEIARIFNQMVFLNGWFHADPHPGNLLIRPAPSKSRSPYNFEVVLLDHGLYFDLDNQFRYNYGRLWLSLIAPGSPSVYAERRKYAKLVGNVDPDLYPIFEAAVTGRAALEGAWDDSVYQVDEENKRASGMLDMLPQSETEKDSIRQAVLQEGILLSVLDVLRRLPRRVLMVLKLNDLMRSLDHSLMTTHSNTRVFIIMAKYCILSVWEDDKKRAINTFWRYGILHAAWGYCTSWLRYRWSYGSLRLIELKMDNEAWMIQTKAYLLGLLRGGPKLAHEAAAGLA